MPILSGRFLPMPITSFHFEHLLLSLCVHLTFRRDACIVQMPPARVHHPCKQREKHGMFGVEVTDL